MFIVWYSLGFSRLHNLHPWYWNSPLYSLISTGENSAFAHSAAAIANHYNLAFSFPQVPITAGWTEAAISTHLNTYHGYTWRTLSITGTYTLQYVTVFINHIPQTKLYIKPLSHYRHFMSMCCKKALHTQTSSENSSGYVEIKTLSHTCITEFYCINTVFFLIKYHTYTQAHQKYIITA